MMRHVVRFHRQKIFILKRKVMNRVMRHIVRQISQHESAEKRPSDRSEIYYEKKVEQHGERQTHRGRHNQTLGILRIIVVHAVERPMNFPRELAFRFVMKQKSVQHIFRYRPKNDAEEKRRNYERDGHFIKYESRRYRRDHDRNVNNQWNGGMHSRKSLQKIAFENSRRLVLVRHK